MNMSTMFMSKSCPRESKKIEEKKREFFVAKYGSKVTDLKTTSYHKFFMVQSLFPGNP